MIKHRILSLVLTGMLCVSTVPAEHIMAEAPGQPEQYISSGQQVHGQPVYRQTVPVLQDRKLSSARQGGKKWESRQPNDAKQIGLNQLGVKQENSEPQLPKQQLTNQQDSQPTQTDQQDTNLKDSQPAKTDQKATDKQDAQTKQTNQQSTDLQDSQKKQTEQQQTKKPKLQPNHTEQQGIQPDPAETQHTEQQDSQKSPTQQQGTKQKDTNAQTSGQHKKKASQAEGTKVSPVPPAISYDYYDEYAVSPQIISGTGRTARASASYKVVTMYQLNYLFPNAIVVDGKTVYEPGTQIRYLQYNGSDAFYDGMSKKACYCMASVLADPAGAVSPSDKFIINKRLNYVLYNGVRRIGHNAYNSSYRSGSWEKDYYITAVAVHLTNMDLGNETKVSLSTLEASVNASNVDGAKDTWKLIKKLYTDAKTAEGTNSSGEISTPDYLLTSSNTTDSWSKQSDGTWNSSKFTVSVSDVYAVSDRKGTVVDDTTGKLVTGVSLIYNTDDVHSGFYVKATDESYKSMGKSGTTLRIISTVVAHSLSGTTFKPNVSTKQPVIAMMFGESEKDKSVTAYARSSYTPPNGSVKVIKKDKDSGAVLPGAQFRLDRWNGNSYSELGMLEYRDGAYTRAGLDPGKYRVTETKPPLGYLYQTPSWSREFTVDEKENGTRDFTYTVDNTKVYPKISISKLAGKTTGVTLVDGRYVGEKKPGWYDLGEKVSFKIIVRNYGNATAKNLQVVDTMTEDLKNAVNVQDAHFLVLEGIKTSLGRPVSIIQKAETYLTIDELAAGDSVAFDFVVTVKSADIPVLEKLKNIVKVTGFYINGPDTLPIPTDEDDEDEDCINIASPRLSVSKLASRTSGVTLVDGRYEGEKQPGWYDYGEQVTYRIIVRNYGNVMLKNLKVSDLLTPDLEQAVKLSSASFSIPEDIRTNLGNPVTITKDKDTELTIHQLESGDSVAFDFVLTIKTDAIPVLTSLQNIVTVTGDYALPHDPESIKPVPADEDDEDEDKINIASPRISISKLANRTVGVTLVNGRYEGEKQPGWYDYGDRVTYRIIVRNYGNVTAKNLKVADLMTDDLKHGVDYSKTSFVVPAFLKTELEKDISVTTVSSTELVIDQLEPEDSVAFDFTVTLNKKHIPVLEELQNIIVVTGVYVKPDDPAHPSPIPVDEDDEDEDKINVADPKVSISKLADRTEGVKLVDGRYQGKKEAGIYYAGEKVAYTIIVRNYGNVTLKDLHVADRMSKELKAAAISDGSEYQIPSNLLTEQKNPVNIDIKGKDAVINLLGPGDSVTFQFTVSLKKDSIRTLKSLSNLVEVSGTYEKPGSSTPSAIPTDEDDRDEDEIDIFCGYVQITKVSSDSSKKLAGAEFTLYTSDGQKAGTFVTDSKGIAKSGPLYQTDYYLKEIKAPDGYQLDSTSYPFKVKSDGETIKVQIKNTPLSPKAKAAKTGDSSPLVPYCLLAFSALTLSIMLTRKKRS
ncbi:MAG: SpaA isopeptide-forming pilin-related protein [Lachnospiraceae bacterium]|nr:SpaA isopeptide-forming pilin-related protein [Lachnospiraceae bacterium]